MLRPALLFVLFLAFALQTPQAQQVESHGVPASVLSPTSPGTAHGTPSSITSPSPAVGANGRVFINRRHFPVRFGSGRGHRPRREIVPVPIFIPAYPLIEDNAFTESDAAAADQPIVDDPSFSTSSSDSEALRQAYYRGAHDALAQEAESRYGDHYMDAREKAQSRPPAANVQAKPSESSGAPEDASAETADVPDNSPATVFIFKDGHRIQTQNYAIVGQTLFDFSNHKIVKIQLAELDLDATKKANDELGISLKFPPPTP